MPEKPEIKQFSDRAADGYLPPDGGNIINAILQRIDDTYRSESSAWKDYSVWYISWRHSSAKPTDLS